MAIRSGYPDTLAPLPQRALQLAAAHAFRLNELLDRMKLSITDAGTCAVSPAGVDRVLGEYRTLGVQLLTIGEMTCRGAGVDRSALLAAVGEAVSVLSAAASPPSSADSAAAQDPAALSPPPAAPPAPSEDSPGLRPASRHARAGGAPPG